MLQFLVKRLVQLVLVMVVVSIIVFVFTSVMGNPVFLMVRENASAEEIAAVSAYLGLDKPLYVQYWIFVKNALQAISAVYMYHLAGVMLIIERLPGHAGHRGRGRCCGCDRHPAGRSCPAPTPRAVSAKASLRHPSRGILHPSSGRHGEIYFFGLWPAWVCPYRTRRGGTVFGVTTSLATPRLGSHHSAVHHSGAGNVGPSSADPRACRKICARITSKFARAKGVPRVRSLRATHSRHADPRSHRVWPSWATDRLHDYHGTSSPGRHRQASGGRRDQRRPPHHRGLHPVRWRHVRVHQLHRGSALHLYRSPHRPS